MLYSPSCEDSADANDDGVIDISDAIRVLTFLFIDSGTILPDPFPDKGNDSTDDNLDCAQ